MKVIAISMSYDCVQEPRCSFCYQNIPYLLSRWLKPQDTYSITTTIEGIIKKYPKDHLTICWEYNGYNLDLIGGKHSWVLNREEIKQTITTMPLAVSKTFVGYVAQNGINAISLSYDNEKVAGVDEWVQKAKIIKDEKMKVCCNYLIQSPRDLNIPQGILRVVDQLNLLSFKPIFKPMKRLSKEFLHKLKLNIELWKGILPVATDNCLAVQLGNINKCMAGEDFIHITPLGIVEACCFRNWCYLYKEVNHD